MLDAAPSSSPSGAFCIGTNQIDLAAASSRGVAVFNAPFSNTRSVVELAIAEIIAMTRRLTEKNALMHDGVWDKSADGAHEVRGRTLGIVGYGNIGTQLSVLAENLGMQVLFYDTADKLALGNARRCPSLKELLAEADVVTLHVDGRPAQRAASSARRSSPAMRPGSLFLNLSRGFVVDYAALREHIESGHIAGRGRGRVPGGAEGPRRRVRLRTARAAERDPHPAHRRVDRGGAAGHRPVRGRQAPRLRAWTAAPRCRSTCRRSPCPDATGTLRLVHLHRNVPGVLAQVNGLLAEHGVNVEAQLLGTRGEFGYVVTDSPAASTQADRRPDPGAPRDDPAPRGVLSPSRGRPARTG